MSMSETRPSSPKKSIPKRLIRLSLWLGTVVIAVFALQTGLLTFPQVVLPNRAEAGSVLVYFDGDPDPAVQILVEETDHRLRSAGFGDPENPGGLHRALHLDEPSSVEARGVPGVRGKHRPHSIGLCGATPEAH